MNPGQDSKIKTENISILRDLADSMKLVLTSRYFYIGVVVLAFGMLLNFASQTYLHNYMSEGKTLPMLSDLILDNIPYMNVGFYYDIGSLLSVFVALTYIVVKKQGRQFSYFLILMGIFYVVRGIFIVLTPFGNPPLFNGSGAPFNGFSRYELGVYPSGQVGNAVMFFLLARDRFFKWLLFAVVIFIIITLLLARGHYSVDIFSGWFFAYAIKSFGEKHLRYFDLSEDPAPL
jgi:membrane-associated phospholipid phosphatase